MKDMIELFNATKEAGLLSEGTEARVISHATVRFIDTKVVVWEGTYGEYVEAFNGGLDEDNQKSFEVIFS